MADTALSTVNRSSTGSRAGCSPQGWEGCLVVQFLLPMPPVELFTPGDAAAGPASGQGMYPNTPTTKTHADCSSGCPSPPQLLADFCSSPASLTPHADSSIQCWSMWAFLTACYWAWWLHEVWAGEGPCWAGGLGEEWKRSYPQRNGAKVIILFGQKKETTFEVSPDNIRHSPESSMGWGSISISQPPKRRS